jgi:hypothetical protein
VGIEGATALWQASLPKHDYMLQPFRHSEIDAIIGADPTVRGIVSEFNRTADFSAGAVSAAEGKVTAAVIAMQAARGWTHGYEGYKASLQAEARGAQDAARDGRGRPTAMLGGDYSTIQSAERKQARAQQAFYDEFGPGHDRKAAYVSSQGIETFLDGVISRDAKFQNADNYLEANSRIRQIVEELAPGEITGVWRSGHGTARDAADIKALGRFTLPQLDSVGNVVMQRWSDLSSVTAIPDHVVSETAEPTSKHQEIHEIVSAS